MNRRSWILLGLITALVVAGPVALTSPAAAHEHVTVGPYAFTVGWLGEPAIAGVLNGLDMGIVQNVSGSMVPFLGAESSVTANLTIGTASLNQAITPQDNRPGWYTFPVILTVAGTYSVRISGTLNTTAINFTVTLDAVAPASDIEFPVTNPSPTEQQQEIAQMSSDIAALQSQVTVLVVLASVSAILAIVGVGLSAVLRRRQRAKA